METQYFGSNVLVFIRSFLIQAFWNFERIQNIGFAYCIFPFLERIYPDRKERLNALHRHLEFYCSHPYMVNIILGLIVSLEERHAQGETAITEQFISQVKAHLSGALAALGDSFFWVSWRSFCAIIASSLYFFSVNQHDAGPAILSVFLFLILYNMAHIPLRWFGFSLAYREGIQIIASIERFRLLNWGKMLAPVSMTFLIIMFVAYIIVLEELLWQKLLLISIFFALLGFKNRETSTIKVVYLTVIIAILLSYIGVA